MPLVRRTPSQQLGDETAAAEREVAHTFAEPGTYRVRVTAEDVAGLMGYDSVTVVVEAGDEKLPPQARIVVNNNDHDAPAEVLYTADAQDPDGVIVANRWTFHDGSTSTDIAVIKAYDEPGTYDVRLEVEDNDGMSFVRSCILVAAARRAGCGHAGSRTSRGVKVYSPVEAAARQMRSSQGTALRT